eukprot:1295698-Lingulodinium_polyedra.AAC.1
MHARRAHAPTPTQQHTNCICNVIARVGLALGTGNGMAARECRARHCSGCRSRQCHSLRTAGVIPRKH